MRLCLIIKSKTAETLHRKLRMSDEFSDSEIVASILSKEGFTTTNDITNADLVFVNTCSIREKAEQTVRKRLSFTILLKNHQTLIC